MATSNGAARYNTPVKYTKTITLKMSDGTTTKVLEQGQALRIEKFLDDNSRFLYIVSDDLKTKSFLTLSGDGCGFCEVATVVSGAEETTPVVCEDGIPACGEYEDLNPTTPTISLNTQNVFVKVGNTATLTANVNPATETVTWKTSDATVATVAAGVVTAVKVGTATITASLAGGQAVTATVNVTAEEPRK